MKELKLLRTLDYQEANVFERLCNPTSTLTSIVTWRFAIL